MLKRVKSIGKKMEKASCNKDMLEAFQLMLLLFGLYMHLSQPEDRQDVLDTLAEIHACFEKATDKKKAKEHGMNKSKRYG